MKALVIGSGGREHALGWKLKQSPLLDTLFFAPGNAGTDSLGTNLPIEAEDAGSLADWAQSAKADLTFVGPEAPLMKGIFEEFSRRDLPLLGPSQNGALLEGSKGWGKAFMERHGIPTGSAALFDSHEEASRFVEGRRFPLVIKADGLAQGKGVVICRDREEANAALASFMLQDLLGEAGRKVVIEEFLTGDEVSAFALFGARGFCYLGEARDYKRAHDGDSGPNTGGMGSVSAPDLVSARTRGEIKKIFARVFNGLKEEGILYRGILYAGLILTEEGVKVLEFNVRFGDPEAQVLIPRMKDDLLPLFLSAVQGEPLPEEAKLKEEISLGVVIAAEGYPGRYEKGIALPDLAGFPPELLLFHASTARRDGTVVNEGGRTLSAVLCGKGVEEIRRKLYAALEKEEWKGFFYRKDIGANFLPSAARGKC